MELFELVKNNVQVHPAAYMLGPLKPILKQRSKDKVKKELAYVYFFADFKSDFADILDDKERSAEIKHILELPNDWEPSEDVLNAVEFYKDRQSTSSMHLLETALQFTKKLKKFYDEVDLNERDEKGKPIHNVRALQQSASELSEMTDNLKSLREAVSKEVEEQSRVRGGGQIGYFEDV